MLDETPDSLSARILQNLRTLIRDKTRFEPDEVQPISQIEFQQPFSIKVEHKLEAVVTTSNINGYFLNKDQSEKIEHADPKNAAEKEWLERQSLAAHQLTSLLNKPETTYNQVKPGEFLPNNRKFWKLNTCGGCQGKGKLVCGHCHGAGEVDCYSCNGSAKVRCTDHSCLNGRSTCTKCHGSGRMRRETPYQVSYTAYNSAGPYTAYRTEYRTEYYSCNSCSGGRVTCPICSGRGHLNCMACLVTGKVRCSGCGGSGAITCNTCSGSGAVGIASWVDINVSQQYSLKLPDDSDSDAKAAIEVEGIHGLPKISEKFLHTNTEFNESLPNTVLSWYDGFLPIAKLEVTCGDSKFGLAAYGTELRWIRHDGMLEYLLEPDLKQLEQALGESLKEGAFEVRIDHLIEPLKLMVSSEINSDILDKEISENNGSSSELLISEGFSARVKQAITGVLSKIYARLAKRFWWKLALLVLIFDMFFSWIMKNADIGMSVGVLIVILGYVFFSRNVAKLLNREMNGFERGEKLARSAKKSNSNSNARLIVILPSVFLIIGLRTFIPSALVEGRERLRPPESPMVSTRDKVMGSANLDPSMQCCSGQAT